MHGLEEPEDSAQPRAKVITKGRLRVRAVSCAPGEVSPVSCPEKLVHTHEIDRI